MHFMIHESLNITILGPLFFQVKTQILRFTAGHER